MRGNIGIFVWMIGLIFLFACSEGEETASDQQKADATKQGETSNEEVDNITSYIGENIEVTADGSIQLPFQGQVLSASFSEDGHVKLLAFDGYVMVVEGEEIIYGETADSRYQLHSDELSVSEDGRFATWKGHLEESEISVYDVENKEAHLVEKTDDQDPYALFPPHLIEKHGDTYYLLTNDYWAAMHYGSDNTLVLDLKTLELTTDRKITDEILPKEPIEDDDKYHTLKAEASVLGLDDGHYSEYGYYKYFYAYEELEEDSDALVLHKLYGGDTENSILKEIKMEDLQFGKDDIRVVNFGELDTEMLQVADNGMYIIPVVDGNVEDNDYTLRVYAADLTEDEPLGTLVREEEVVGERPTVFFNEDATAIYFSTPGLMEKYIIKE